MRLVIIKRSDSIQYDSGIGSYPHCMGWFYALSRGSSTIIKADVLLCLVSYWDLFTVDNGNIPCGVELNDCAIVEDEMEMRLGRKGRRTGEEKRLFIYGQGLDMTHYESRVKDIESTNAGV